MRTSASGEMTSVGKKGTHSCKCYNTCNSPLRLCQRSSTVSAVGGIFKCPAMDVGTASETSGELDPERGQRPGDRGVRV